MGTWILLTNVIGVQRIGDRGHVVRVGADLGDQVRRLAVQDLVGLAGLIPVLDPLQRPRLAAGLRCRHGVVGALLAPAEREPGVEDAAGVQRRGGVVDHRQRRDRGQVRRVGGGHEQLADRRRRRCPSSPPCGAGPRAGGRRSRSRRSRRGPAAARSKSNAPPEQPVPRMLTSTTANPSRLAIAAIPLCGPAGSA